MDNERRMRGGWITREHKHGSKKPGLTREEHRALSARLIALDEHLVSFYCDLSSRYPLKSKTVSGARKLSDSLRFLRNQLDEAAFKEDRVAANEDGMYFGDAPRRRAEEMGF